MKWLKHAFAIDPPGPAEPTPEQKSAVDKICAEIVRRHLTTPALLFLETSRPLNFLGAQAMHFFMPVISVLTESHSPRHFAEFLSQRGSVDYLCRRIEDYEAEADAKAKTGEETSSDQENESGVDCGTTDS